MYSRSYGNKLYVKKEKCEFCQQKVLFLGYWVSHSNIHMDERKVKAILDWINPKKVPKLQYFLVYLITIGN